MPVITLTTEWRSDDIYEGIIRGKLCSLCPEAVVVTNASGITPFDILHASFVVRNTYGNYPTGSVHLICVHSEARKDEDYLIVRARGHYFIGTANGIFNLILNSPPDEAVRIRKGNTTNELEVFAEAAAGIVSGSKMEDLGESADSIAERMPLRATIDRDVIVGSIIFVDSYGNVFSNITREVFSRVIGNSEFKILIQSNKNYTNRISEHYHDVSVGDLLARFNSLDLLEIAINGANISELLSLSVGSVVRIERLGKETSADRLF